MATPPGVVLVMVLRSLLAWMPAPPLPTWIEPLLVMVMNSPLDWMPSPPLPT
jgi:hypothetical protein